MWFRYLTASAVCATLLGLAASSFVRTHLFEVMSALTRQTSEASPSDEFDQADDSSLSAVDMTREDVMPGTRTSALLVKQAGKGHLGSLARPASSHNPARDTFLLELDRGIRKLSERRYEIRRRTLELALGNLGPLASLVRVLPDTRDGKPVGFRLFAIRADGPLAKLGLRNEDVLVSINGLALATPERVLDAYSKLKKASHWVLGLLRERHEITLEYTIR